MNFLLKIVEGPNKGAEIALVSGVAVTLGKNDDCDIVLADTTLPSTPITLEASETDVTVDGEPIEQFAVKTVGATSFAVGPADAQWGALKWPERAGNEERETGNRQETREEKKKEEPSPQASSAESGESTAEPESEGKESKRGGCCGCLVVFALILVVLAGLAWFFRDRLAESNRLDQLGKIGRYWYSRASSRSGSSSDDGAVSTFGVMDLSVVAARYGLSVEEGDGPAKLTGNLKTRAERLCATAEAYAVRPGLEIDISDDESFRTAAEDALFTLTEGALKVLVATNRVLSIVGVSRSPEELTRTLKAVDADIPRLRNVDVTRVRFGEVPKHDTTDSRRDEPLSVMSSASRLKSKKSSHPSLPVCGILTKPYPCLVMRDGTRVMEGASLGGNVIVKIAADAVTVTNSTGRFVWKP